MMADFKKQCTHCIINIIAFTLKRIMQLEMITGMELICLFTIK